MPDRRSVNRSMFWRVLRRSVFANRGRLFVILLALGAGSAVTAALLNLQIDAKRRIIYAGTGDNFSEPDTRTSDAVLAFDLDSGKLLWSKQLTEHDIFNVVCAGAGCGEHLGPDVDIGASPILVTTLNGNRELLISQKSGVVSALDPDHQGKRESPQNGTAKKQQSQGAQQRKP